MIRRYNLERSDNFMFTGKMSFVGSGSGIIKVETGFKVTSATVSFATIPCSQGELYSSSSSSSSEGEILNTCPRLYVSSYAEDGFYVTYEGISEDVGFIEFNLFKKSSAFRQGLSS